MLMKSKLHYLALLAAFHSTAPLAATINYTETGSDGYGDSFSVDFQWSTTTRDITSIQSASITAPTVGTISATNPGFGEVNTYPYSFGGSAVDVDNIGIPDATGDILVLRLYFSNQTANPVVGDPYAPGFGAAEFFSFGLFPPLAATFNSSNTVLSVDNPVPEPTIIALLASGILGISTSRGLKSNATKT